MVHNSIDRPGVLHFFTGYGPAPVIGPLDAGIGGGMVGAVCDDALRWRHYELVVCDVSNGCDGACRGWHEVTGVDDNGHRTHSWRHVGEQAPLPKADRDLEVA